MYLKTQLITMTKVSCKAHNLCHKSGRDYKIKGIGIYYIFLKRQLDIRPNKSIDMCKAGHTANQISHMLKF